jgi:hypothetical protein
MNRKAFILDGTNSSTSCRLVKVLTSRHLFVPRHLPQIQPDTIPNAGQFQLPPLHNGLSRLRKEGLTPDLGIDATNIVPTEPPQNLTYSQLIPFYTPGFSFQAHVSRSSLINTASVSARSRLHSVTTR